MKFEVLNSNMDVIFELEDFQSLIWSKKIREYGELEIYGSVSSTLLSILYKMIKTNLNEELFLLSDTFYRNNKADLMILEDASIIKSNDESKILINGRCLKSILLRRVILKTTFINKPDENGKGTSVEEAIKSLIYDNIINPEEILVNPYYDIKISGDNRKISNFKWINSNKETPIINEDTEITIGTYLYDAINDLCEKYKISYEIEYDFNISKFIMYVKIPIDRSYDQYIENPILLSSENGELSDSNYIIKSSEFKNVGIGIGEYNSEKYISITNNEITGLSRRENYVDASSIERDLSDGTILNLEEQFPNAIKEKTQNDTDKLSLIKAFESEISDNLNFKYNKDYFIGDTIEILNEYEIDSKVVVSEIVLTVSNNEITLIPTFISDIENEKEGE